MRSVSPGEPILPALTAEWYNHTIKPHPSPPQGRPQPHRHQNEILAKFQIAGEYTEAARFDPVAISGIIDDVKFMDRSCYVDKASLNEYNWIVPQATMREGQLSQPCVYTGLTFANVNILDGSHNYVTLNDGTKTLESSDSGKAILLYGNSTGPSLISIGGGGGGEGATLVRFDLLGSISNGSAPADIFDIYGVPLETASVGDPLNIFSSLTTGNDGLAIKQGGQYYVIQAPCPGTGNEETS